MGVPLPALDILKIRYSGGATFTCEGLSKQGECVRSRQPADKGLGVGAIGREKSGDEAWAVAGRAACG